jgi:PD-(D/E)XK endonuclease
VDTNRKGNVAELAIAKEAAKLGLSVLMPLTEHERYDLALELNGKLLRVQCKWARKVGSVVIANLSRNRRGPDGFIRRNYSADEIDAFGIYCGELDECFWSLLISSMDPGVSSFGWTRRETASAPHYTSLRSIDLGL